jgi:hypothetical protein
LQEFQHSALELSDKNIPVVSGIADFAAHKVEPVVSFIYCEIRSFDHGKNRRGY